MYTLAKEQKVNTSLSAAWDFLKNPSNLNRITPDDLNFEIVSEVPDEMQNGLIVEYRIKIPFIGFQKWVAEIKHINPLHSFVDEQRIGPYAFWYHYHQLVEMGNGVKLIDRVHYQVPFGPVGRLLHFLFIRRTLERIFDFRKEKITEILHGEH